MGTMSISSTAGAVNMPGRFKMTTIVVAGSASYATGGDTIDLSTSGTLGVANGFSGITGVVPINVGAAADDVYRPFYVGATAATGKIKFRDLSAASDAEVTAATDLSAKSWTFLVIGY